MDTGNTSRWALYWRNKCERSLEQVREELNPLFKRIAMPRLRKEIKMIDSEVNRRAREVEKELCEMRKQWIEIYDLIMRLIDDTDGDYYSTYAKCIDCEHSDCDRNGLRCMISDIDKRPCN